MAEAKKYNAPVTNPETAPFWEAAKAGKFMIKRCTACGEPHYFPRSICPFCFSDKTVWEEASGEGTIYTYSLTRKSPTGPYAIGYVTLKEGPSLLTNFVDGDLTSLKIGQKVKVVFQADRRPAAAVLHAGLTRRLAITQSTDNFVATQFGDAHSGKTHLSQNLIGMLPQRRWWQTWAALFSEKSHRVTNAVEATGFCMVVLHDDFARFGVCMFEELGKGIDRRTGNTDLGQGRIPLLDCLGCDRGLHMAQRFRAVGDAVRIGPEAGVVNDGAEARDRAELAPEIVVGHANHDRPIGRLECLIGAKRFMAGAALGGLDPALPKGLQIVTQQSEGGVEQRHLDGSSLARLLPRQQAGQNAAESMYARHLIDWRNGATDIAAVLIARHRHNAAEGLQNYVVPRRVLQRP
jgi:uncharacterized protein